jgi:ParB family transcriptional regulator, chromosome partitioning protein
MLFLPWVTSHEYKWITLPWRRRIDGLEDNKLTGFALRLALIGHMDTPREGEFDFLAEAEAAFAPPQPKNAASKKPKVKTPTPIKAASKSAPKKAAAKKKTAA